MIRPRFTLRALLVLIAVVGVYIATWQLTVRRAVDPDAAADLLGAAHFFRIPSDPKHLAQPFSSSPAPFVVSRTVWIDRNRHEREYHLWFFGTTRRIATRRLSQSEVEPAMTELIERGAISPPTSEQ